jgi:hypothetical protein
MNIVGLEIMQENLRENICEILNDIVVRITFLLC